MPSLRLIDASFFPEPIVPFNHRHRHQAFQLVQWDGLRIAFEPRKSFACVRQDNVEEEFWLPSDRIRTDPSTSLARPSIAARPHIISNCPSISFHNNIHTSVPCTRSWTDPTSILSHLVLASYAFTKSLYRHLIAFN